MSIQVSVDVRPGVRAEPLPVMWHTVCPATDITPDRGVAVLLDRTPVAIFRVAAAVGCEIQDDYFAVAHTDPRTGAPTIARGLVGSVGDTAIVAAPIHKDRYELATGKCLDDEKLSLQTFSVRVSDGSVQIGANVTLPKPAGNTRPTHS